MARVTQIQARPGLHGACESSPAPPSAFLTLNPLPDRGRPTQGAPASQTWSLLWAMGGTPKSPQKEKAMKK